MNTGGNNIVSVHLIQNRASRDTIFSSGLHIGRQKHLLANSAIDCGFLNTPISAVEQMFITSAELTRSLHRHGLRNTKLVGTRAGGNPLKLLLALRRYKAGKISGAEFGQRAGFKEGPNIAGSYIDYAVKP